MRSGCYRLLALLAGLAALTGCSGIIPSQAQSMGGLPPSSPPASSAQGSYVIPGSVPLPPAGGAAILPGASPEQALGNPLRLGRDIASLPIGEADARAALQGFRLSCPSLVTRQDASGLTRPEDWRPACDAAAGWPDDNGFAFFANWFEPLQVGDGAAFATGYFEPEIAGSRERRAGYDVPVYGRPADLIDVDLGQFNDELAGKRVRGKVSGASLVLYDDRTMIEQGSLGGRAPVIAWAADPIEFFFLQVQGSGRLRQPDGTVMRIGYASQNGRAYTGIGKLMRDRGLLAPGQANMQGIVDWLRAHPAEGQRIMRENQSFVFFRELTGPGPLGALGYAVTGGTSLAVDPAFVPMGAPVFLSMDRQEPNGLWIAQDTGGAIKGANRFDTFWGAGAEARTIAGGMSARGQALILVPRGTFDRLAATRP
ncbi:MAG: murein transglycosylase A [Blastomonas sp.]